MNNYVFVNPNSLPSVIAAGFYQVNTPWLHFSRTLELDALIFVIEGVFSVNEDNVNYVVPKNNIFFFKNGKHHFGKEEIQPGSKWYWICFSPVGNENHLFPLPKQFPILGTNAVVNIFNELINLTDSAQPFQNSIANNLLHKFFLDILTQSYTPNNSIYSNDKIIADNIIKCLENKAFSKFSSTFLIQELNLDFSYMCRIFKKEIGITINKYHSSLRINKSIELLKENKYTLSEISDKLSFPNQYYFSKVFKETTGYSPQNYMKMIYF